MRPTKRSARTWLDDLTLLERWREGDERAQRTLMRRYDQLARQRLRHRVPGQDIDDVVQQALLRFVNALDAYDGRGSLRAFYATIESRAMLDYYRRRYREPETFDPDLLTTEDLGVSSPSREASLSRHLARLARALETELTLNERLVVEQLLVERLPIQLVARGLDRAESSVRHILMRARRKLKNHFGPDYMEIARGDELGLDALGLDLARLGRALWV